MAHVNGQLTTCDRCGAQIFRKAVGEGEADGGYTRWNKFEEYPEGWRIVALPEGTKEKYNNAMVCPKCSAQWDKVLTERFVNGSLLDPGPEEVEA